MQPFDKPPPPPRRSLWDRISYVLCVAVIWVAALYEMLNR
jgi:hypothetical protein